MRELPVPQAAMSDASSRELARVWAASGEQHVSLEIGIWEDPAAWGLLLVDLARHVANAFEQLHGRDGFEVLKRIREGFDAEWEFPTSPATGLVE